LPKKKKSLKERQRERLIKLQRSQEAYRIQREVEAKEKPRKLPKGKILFVVALPILIVSIYGIIQFASPAPSNNTTPSGPDNGISPTSGFIFINSDGRVIPSTASITNNANSQYTFTADIHDSIIVQKDNIIIDGANHALQGTDELGSVGIDLTSRTNVTVTNLKIQGFEKGINVTSGFKNYILRNEFNNNYYGIWIHSSNNNEISENKITNSEMGGILIKSSLNNLISKNELTSHGNYTIYIGGSSSTNIISNYIADNNLGIFLYNSSNNNIYHNKFANNRGDASNLDSTNIWDNGYPSGGNHWSDYEQKYSNAQELNGSGIWDTPYVLDDNNKDNYPLINR
jgi:parallel beta-helix repeat protein